jgi:hypothetical protein
VDDVRVAVGQKTSLAPLTSNAGLLVTSEDSLRSRLLPRVDKDGSGFKSSRNLGCLLDIFAPHTGTETHLGVVGTGNDLLEVRPWLCGDNGAEWLLLYDSGVVGRVVDSVFELVYLLKSILPGCIETNIVGWMKYPLDAETSGSPAANL